MQTRRPLTEVVLEERGQLETANYFRLWYSRYSGSISVSSQKFEILVELSHFLQSSMPTWRLDTPSWEEDLEKQKLLIAQYEEKECFVFIMTPAQLHKISLEFFPPSFFFDSFF